MITLKVTKITKRKAKRYISFSVTNTDEKPLPPNPFRVRVHVLKLKSGEEIRDPGLGFISIDPTLDTQTGKLSLDLSEYDEPVEISLGVVLEHIKWCVEVPIKL